MLSTVKTLKNDEFFRVFAIFLVKIGGFPYSKKGFNFMLTFAFSEQKQDLNLIDIICIVYGRHKGIIVSGGCDCVLRVIFPKQLYSSENNIYIYRQKKQAIRPAFSA